MSGPLLTVSASPAVTKLSHTFHRSHSTPDLLSNITPSIAVTSQHHQDSLSLKNLPSAPSLPDFDVSSFDLDFHLDTDFSLPERQLTLRSNEKSTIVQTESTLAAEEPRADKMGKRKSMLLGHSQSWLPTSKSSPDFRQLEQESIAEKSPEKVRSDRKDAGNSEVLEPSPLERSSRTVSDSFASFARRSWISTSRSPSPSPKKKNSTNSGSQDSESRGRSSSTSSTNRRAKLSRKRPMSTIEGDANKSTDSLAKFSSYLSKIKQRPQNALVKGSLTRDADSTSSSVASLAPPSTNARQSNSTSDNSTATTATMPDGHAFVPTPQIRDPLWSVFKTLESDFIKFQVKSTPMKMNVVRSCLIPFLRNFSGHPSNKRLHYEDLERRALILNKWWTGLLEMFDGKTSQPVAGVDRPTLLEAVTIVMMRSEWRQSTSCFTPLVDRNPRERVKRGRSTSPSHCSVDSTDSDYIAESAEHNVRTIFINNLVLQMSIVMEKLSQRHAPLSLVNFAGKACAYAFFFAPGIADVLVRLWGLSSDLIRRVADEFKLPRRSKGESDDIVALFPPNLDQLGWSSVKTMSDSLRQPAKMPLPIAKIPWHGPWVARWRGRDTDLFFIFCKYYYILAEEFMPSELPLSEKGRAPAFVLVNAQMLFNLDLTVHRQAAVEAMMGPPLADAIHGADASLLALPIAPNNNVLKGMDENRFIVLLKDFLSATSILYANARHTFAESFMALMKASAKRTSQFDHNACFTLCDFLEESLVTYEGFVDVQRPTLEYVDWPFWFEVCKRILESCNTMSEIRVLSLVFSIWDAITSDESRKEAVCLDWLLTEENFDNFFNNWCPMVRAYYMRLLCWRICRDAGSSNELDIKIFLVVSNRLKTTWSHYLWLKDVAEAKHQFPPSTAPSYPTPGKRFMIIRTEVPVVQRGMVMGFDSFSTSLFFPDPSISMSSPPESIDSGNTEPDNQKKRWNLIGKVLSLSGTNDLDSARRETAASRKPAPPPKQSAAVTPPTSDSDSMGSSPVYEALQFFFKFTLSWNAPNTIPPPHHILTKPRLPLPAQARVTSRERSGSASLPAAGRPPPTRAISGSASTGLVDAARNADPSEVPPVRHRVSVHLDRLSSIDPTASPIESSIEEHAHDAGAPSRRNIPSQDPLITRPAKPIGFYAKGAKYAGRALAEWSLVVNECNSFVDRRRDEGVLGLSEVEVPALSVEGFRKLG